MATKMETEMHLLENRKLLILLLIIPIVIWFVDYNANDNGFSFCIFKIFFGIKCYGCGFLRGVSALLHLKFHRIYELNKINLISIPLIGYLYVLKIKSLLKDLTRH
jgi:hypothetical protein